MAGKHRQPSRRRSPKRWLPGLTAVAVSATGLSTAVMTGTTTTMTVPAVKLAATVLPANSTAQIFAGSTYYGQDYAKTDPPTQVVPFFLGPRGIAVNTIAPGAIETDFAGGSVRDNKEVNKFIASVTALGRPGLPDDIGPAVAALLSEDNHWINAQRIEVSGGMFV